MDGHIEAHRAAEHRTETPAVASIDDGAPSRAGRSDRTAPSRAEPGNEVSDHGPPSSGPESHGPHEPLGSPEGAGRPGPAASTSPEGAEPPGDDDAAALLDHETGDPGPDTDSDPDPDPDPDPEEPLRLSVSEPGDVLALVHHTLGFMPEESLVVIGLTRGVTGAHLRVDLGASADDPHRLARWAADCLGGAQTDPPADGAVLLVFGAEAPRPPMNDDESLRPHAALCGAVEAELGRHGMPVVQTWHVGDGRIRDFHCPDPACCPYPGQDVRTAVHSVLNAHMVYRGRRVLQTPPQIVDEFLQDRRPEARHCESVREHRLAAASALPDPDVAERALVVWECLLDDALSGLLDDQGPRAGWFDEHAEELGLALAALADRQVRDALLVQAAIGVAVGVVGLRVCQVAAPGETPREALHRADLPTGAPAEELETLLADFEAAFMGSTGERPDWERIDALESLLSWLHHAADETLRAELLAMVGWIEWARGRGSIAGAYLDRCRTLVPGHGLAELLEQAMAMGGICPWARVREHSWSHRRGRR